VTGRGRASRRARLEAAAICVKMIAAQTPDTGTYMSTIAHRFTVEEDDLRRALRSAATQRTYDRIHSNVQPLAEAG
jgi:hypothetical protein